MMLAAYSAYKEVTFSFISHESQRLIYVNFDIESHKPRQVMTYASSKYRSILATSRMSQYLTTRRFLSVHVIVQDT